jgi:multiple sugar transport system permease protein
MVVFLAGLQSVPESLYDAAKIDGANSWGRFWNVTLPILSPIVLFNLIITIIQHFQVFTTALIATPDGGPQNAALFYVLYLYRNAFSFFKMGYASTLAWVFFLIILIFTLIQFYLSKKWVHYETD